MEPLGYLPSAEFEANYHRQHFIDVETSSPPKSSELFSRHSQDLRTNQQIPKLSHLGNTTRNHHSPRPHT